MSAARPRNGTDRPPHRRPARTPPRAARRRSSPQGLGTSSVPGFPGRLRALGGCGGPCRGPPRSSANLEQAGRAHAAADAHGADDVTGAAALALDQRVADHARAAHAVRMADGDRAAVDVELLHRDAELVAAVDDLHGERLVQLPEIDLIHSEAEALEESRHGEDGPDT